MENNTVVPQTDVYPQAADDPRYAKLTFFVLAKTLEEVYETTRAISKIGTDYQIICQVRTPEPRPGMKDTFGVDVILISPDGSLIAEAASEMMQVVYQ